MNREQLEKDLTIFDGNTITVIGKKYKLNSLGHVWDVYPEFQGENYFYFGFVYEGELDGEKFRAYFYDDNKHDRYTFSFIIDSAKTLHDERAKLIADEKLREAFSHLSLKEMTNLAAFLVREICDRTDSYAFTEVSDENKYLSDLVRRIKDDTYLRPMQHLQTVINRSNDEI